MLYPVMETVRNNAPIKGFAQTRYAAERILGARAKLYDFRAGSGYADVDEVWNACEAQRRAWHQIAETMGYGGEFRIALPKPQYRVGGEILMRGQAWMLDRDIPIGRTPDEALREPFGFHPRTRKKVLAFQGMEARKTFETLPKAYVRRGNAERSYGAHLRTGVLTLCKGEDGRWRARLAYWKLPEVALPRDKTPEALGEQFDMWGNWHPDDVALTVGGLKFETTQEGTGKVMGD